MVQLENSSKLRNHNTVYLKSLSIYNINMRSPSLQSDHNSALSEFVRWCDDSFLDLNVSKTRELIIDFRRHSDEPKLCVIHNENVQIV